MPTAKAIVLLSAYRGADVLNIPNAVPWYVQYFFNPDYGQKAFWLKQTDNDIVFDGEVSDWAFYPEGSLNLGNRTATAQTAVDAMRQDRNIDFSRFDMVIVVLGLNANVASDGGSTQVNVDGRRLRAIVSRLGDPFDFMSHEIGHGLGLYHSFGSVLFQAIGERPGGYGHPHCIMSAMAYGGIPGGGPFVPASPRDGRPEYSSLGPGLNAVAALRKGWLHAHTFNMADGIVREFDIRSRHWGGRNPGLAPQAVEILAPNGDNYIIEYREKAGWDMGQDAAYLIVAQDRGGIGDQAYPNASVGTYISQIRLPVTLGGLGHARNFLGYGLQVINRSPNDHTLRIRLHPGKAPLIGVVSSSRVETIERRVLETGTTTWEPGEKVCVEGSWRYEKVAQTQRATFEATCGDGMPPIRAVWTVAGQTIFPSGTISVVKEVQVANPKLAADLATRSVTLVCELEPLPNGSRLRVTSSSPNETFDLDVEVELQSPIGSATETFQVELAGVVYDYGEDFEARRLRCLVDLSDVGRKYATYEVLFDPDIWWKIPPTRREEIETYLGVLAHLRSQEDLTLFDRASADVPRLAMTSTLQLAIMSRGDRLRVALPDEIDERPAPRIDLQI